MLRLKFYEFIIFILIDTFLHYLVVLFEVKTNKDLFIDLEFRPLFRFKNNNLKDKGDKDE